MDIATVWVPAASRGDWAVLGPDLRSGADLETAVLISLFTDRRADPDDVIPDGSGDPRGWWGDLGEDRPIGSKLWLLERAKQTEPVRLRAKDYVDQALAWLVQDGIAAAVETQVTWNRPGGLAVVARILEPDGSLKAEFAYQWAWEGVN